MDLFSIRRVSGNNKVSLQYYDWRDNYFTVV